MLVESQLGLEDVLEAFSERNFDIQSKSLIESFQDKKLRRTVIQRFLHHPLLHIHDIARAAYLLAALEEGVDLGYQFLCMHQTQSGAALLFRRAGFYGEAFLILGSMLRWLCCCLVLQSFMTQATSKFKK